MPIRGAFLKSGFLPWALLAFALVTLWSALLALQRQDERSAVRQAEADMQNLARAFAEHTLSSLQRVDYVLQRLRRSWQENPGGFPEEVAFHQDLMRDIAFQVAVIGADGRMDFSNLARTTERIDLSDREHFTAPREFAARSEDRLFVSRPLKGRVSGKWSIQIARPILHADGRFAGVMVVSIAPAFFSAFYDTIELGEGGAAVMVRDSGDILSRAPDLEAALGKVLTGTPYLAADAPEFGTFTRTAQVDGKERIYGFRRLPKHGVTLVVGISREAVLAGRQAQRHWQWQGAAAISLLLIVLTLILQRSLSRQARAQMALAESSSMLRSIYEVLPLGIAVLDRHGGIVDSNAAAEKILGLTRDEILTRSLRQEDWNIVRPDGTPMPVDEYAGSRALRSGMPVFDVEMGVMRGSAQGCDRRWLQVSAMPLPATVGGAVVAYADITERKRQELRLAASEHRFRALFDSFTDMVFVIDTSGRLAMAHVPPGEWLADADAGALVGKEMGEIFAPEIAGAIADALAGVMAESTTESTTVSAVHTVNFRHAFGKTPRDYQARISALRGEHAWPDGFVLVARDVTAERQAAESQRIAATTFESQEGMMISDHRGVILRVNRAFTELTGYAAEEVVGKTPAILKSGRQSDAFYRDMWSQLADKGYWQGEVWNRRKGGELFPEWLTISAVRDDTGRTTHYVGAFSDISERKEAETQIRNLAFYDPLTGLPNRRLMLDRLQQALAAGHRSGSHGAIVYLDLDHFKLLNDTRGHDAGDELLVAVANRLRACVREEDTVARLGGDEFVVMLESLDTVEAAAAGHAGNIAENIRLSLGEPYPLRSGDYILTPSLGVSLFRGHDSDVQTLLKQADMALYEAKEAGRNTFRFFNHAMQDEVIRRARTIVDMRDAIERHEFEVYLQAQVDADGRRIGAEALLRWRHPERGLVMPNDFIPLAEDSGLIVPIGLLVLDAACGILAAWRAAGSDDAISINVSARQFHQPDFVDDVASALARHDVEGRRLCLELTESTLLADVAVATARMEKLKAMGVILSLDDFGTGYSSLASLRHLPIDEVKIDRSFVRDVARDPQDAEIVRAIVAMCHSLGMSVVAEGVEEKAQHDYLLRCGCEAFQGYLFGRPAPLSEYRGSA